MLHNLSKFALLAFLVALCEEGFPSDVYYMSSDAKGFLNNFGMLLFELIHIMCDRIMMEDC